MNLNFSYLRVARTVVASLAVLLCLSQARGQEQQQAAGADAFYLKDGDRVVFYGDSITNQRIYTMLVETFVLTRLPQRDVRFVHSGWGGDRVGGGVGGRIDTRLQRDVFAWDPTVVTVMLGMNDASYRPFDQGIFDVYQRGLTSIVDKLESNLPKSRVTLIRPSAYDDFTRQPRFEGGYNTVLVRYGDAVEELAKGRGHHVADLNSDLVKTLKDAREKNAELSTKIISDYVHPGPAGHLVMAASLLKSWDAPAVVSDVVIAASSKAMPRVLNAENTTVSDLKESNGTLQWTQADRALPLPMDLADSVVALAAEVSGVVDEINRQMLRVEGLPAPFYILKIDGEQIGIYSARELAAGINLAVLPTPMLKQAIKVHELTVRRGDTHQTRWRSVQVPYTNVESEEMAQAMPTILAAFDAEVEKLRQLQRQQAQPKAHRYELVPQQEVLSVFGSAEPTTLLPASGSTNLALNKSWVSSSANTFGWDRGLTDGSWNAVHGTTYATGSHSDFPKTVTVDLERSQPLSRVIIGVPSIGSTKTVAVSLSDDGKTFREVGRYAFQQRQEEKRLFAFPKQSARYIRLTYLDYHPEQVNYSPFFMFTTDLQAYAD